MTFKLATLPKTFAATASIITLVNSSVWHPPSPQDTEQSLWFLNNVSHSEVGMGELQQTESPALDRPRTHRLSATCPVLVDTSTGFLHPSEFWTLQQAVIKRFWILHHQIFTYTSCLISCPIVQAYGPHFIGQAGY